MKISVVHKKVQKFPGQHIHKVLLREEGLCGRYEAKRLNSVKKTHEEQNMSPNTQSCPCGAVLTENILGSLLRETVKKSVTEWATPMVNTEEP